MKQFCIIIPVYKNELDCVEKISLKRLYDVIGTKGYDIYLVCPPSLDKTQYDAIYPGMDTECFDAKYFTDTAAYSQLCISYDFYNRFSDYEYILIYQLDCYLFTDDIAEWCSRGYDYIGAPIVSTDCGWTTLKKKNEKTTWQPYVGNGGLSLRKIDTFKEITDPDGEFRRYYKLTDDTLSVVRWEDKYFCNDLYDYYKLRIPRWDIACSFALDMSVDVIYNYLGWKGQPMGIHSVDKNIRWWKKHIPEFADPDVIAYCEKKHEEFFKLYYDEHDSTLR